MRCVKRLQGNEKQQKEEKVKEKKRKGEIQTKHVMEDKKNYE